MNIAILTSVAVNPNHGSGVQILRIFDGSEFELVNFYWSDRAGLTDISICSILLNRVHFFKKIFGASIAKYLDCILPFKWWSGQFVNKRKLSKFLKKNKLKFDSAYVVPANEFDCLRMLSLLSVLGCPYVIHMMDLCHDDGINIETMPGYFELISSARSVLVSSKPMFYEVNKVRSSGVFEVFLGKSLTKKSEFPLGDSRKIRIVVLGSVGGRDNPSLKILEDVMLSLDGDDRFEFVYMGQHYNYFSDYVKKRFIYYKGLDLKNFEERLLSVHIAYLPYPYLEDCYSKFAPLGKLVDIFMAGLPLIVCINKKSYAYNFLLSLECDSIKNITDKNDFLNILYQYSIKDKWETSSQKIRKLAEEMYGVDKLKKIVYKSLV